MNYLLCIHYTILQHFCKTLFNIFSNIPENKKKEFIEIHKTNSKLNFASQYTDVSEVFYILQPVYNDSLHLNDDQGDDAKIKSCSLKLYNIPIKNIIKIIFNL